VRAALVRLPGSSMSAAASPTAAGIDFPSLTIPWTSQVNVTSVQIPITQIRLVRAGGSFDDPQLYECPAPTAAGCLVELNGPALQNLLGTAPVATKVGTYDRVAIGYCKEPVITGYRLFATATAIIGGTTYYTRTTGTLGTTGPAEPVFIDFTGCASEYPISPPLVIADSLVAILELRLYFDMFNIATAVLPSPQADNIFVGGPCTARPVPGTPFVCVSSAVPVAVVGTIPPVIEYYRVNNTATIGLVFDATTDLWYGGYVRRFMVEDQPWNLSIGEAFFASMTSTGGGTYRLVQTGSTFGSIGTVFPAWQRATHTGTMTRVGGSTAPYSAVRLP
ncbi:MAG: hypothetical protein AAB075_01250, partial [Gemmatimonadota bacterium]